MPCTLNILLYLHPCHSPSESFPFPSIHFRWSLSFLSINTYSTFLWSFSSTFLHTFFSPLLFCHRLKSTAISSMHTCQTVYTLRLKAGAGDVCPSRLLLDFSHRAYQSQEESMGSFPGSVWQAERNDAGGDDLSRAAAGCPTLAMLLAPLPPL